MVKRIDLNFFFQTVMNDDPEDSLIKKLKGEKSMDIFWLFAQVREIISKLHIISI